MFDVSLGELLIIGAVTLIVVGPEKMPKVARTAGMLFGRLQRFVNNVRGDLQREMQASELAQIQQEIEAEAAEIKNTIHQPLAESSLALQQLEADFQQQLAPGVTDENPPVQPDEPLIQQTTADSDTSAGKRKPRKLVANDDAAQEPVSTSKTRASAEPQLAAVEAAPGAPDNQLDLFADLDEASDTSSDRR
ncbi:Sec-independent protein translocase protein TatB [Chitinibacter sp. S2-10]|uniref:Sec-independent protein translocase protein TatB n=1 Tax=Chitinibacter sp. S2-10 TaxID=3373597 RepID=UPI003977674F